MSDKPDEPERDDSESELVVAPGGPRRKSTVVKVEPGEIVRRNADGTYSVVPRPRGPDTA
jgi:hypothetical protein